MVSAQMGDLDGDGRFELVALSSNRLQILEMDGSDAPKLLAEKKSGLHESFHRIWLIPSAQNPQARDILLCVFEGERVRSSIYRYDGGKIVQQSSHDQLLVFFSTLISDTIWAQELHSAWRFSHLVQRSEGGSGTVLKLSKRQPFFNGLGQTAPSLLSLTKLTDGFVLIDGDGRLNLLSEEAKPVWRSGMTYGGAYDFAESNEPDGLGLKRERRFFIEPRMVYDELSHRLYVVRNEGFVKNVIGAIPAMKWAQVMALEVGDQRLTEKTMLPRVDGAITDIQLVDFNQDGMQDLFVTVLVRKLGMLDSLRDQETVFVVLPLGTPSGIVPPAVGTDTGTGTATGTGTNLTSSP